MLSISFPKPTFTIVFDAVGTLLRAVPSVAEAYLDAARHFGWDGDLSEIDQRFRSSFASLSGRQHDWQTNEDLQRSRWRELVGRVFGELPAAQADGIFERLWLHFALPTSWELFPDARSTLELCNERGIPWCIGSNFDARLHSVVAGHEELRTCQHVFCSSEVGYDKPATEFFHEIERRLGIGAERFIMVGDDRELDAAAAERAGWIGLWLNRNPASKVNDLDAPPQLATLEELEPWML